MFHQENRKIQKTGGSSYIISLPIDWIKSHNIDKNYKGYSLGILFHWVNISILLGNYTPARWEPFNYTESE